MRPHKFRYYVYDREGKCIFETCNKLDAETWVGGNGNSLIRKDLLGNYPDKKIL